MRLYHGSDLVIESPSLAFSRDAVDFGRGFYLTSYEEQAERWAKRKALRSRGSAVVNIYELGERDMDSLAILEFDGYGLEWLEFVCANRNGVSSRPEADVVIGPVADDKVFEAVNMYFQGLWDAKTTLDALVFYELNDQLCFATEAALSKLKFIEGRSVLP